MKPRSFLNNYFRPYLPYLVEHSWLMALPYLQILGLPEIINQGETIQLISLHRQRRRRKKFYNVDARTIIRRMPTWKRRRRRRRRRRQRRWKSRRIRNGYERFLRRWRCSTTTFWQNSTLNKPISFCFVKVRLHVRFGSTFLQHLSLSWSLKTHHTKLPHSCALAKAKLKIANTHCKIARANDP